MLLVGFHLSSYVPSFLSNKAEYVHLNYWHIMIESLSLKCFSQYFLQLSVVILLLGCSELMKISVTNIINVSNVRV
jgi:hypothetical protein